MKLTGRTHHFKIWRAQYVEVRDGIKTFEFREETDKVADVGDVLELAEFNDSSVRYTGRQIKRVVTSVLRRGFGIPDGYAIYSLAKIPRRK